MTMRSLIDTDWVIYHLNGRADIIQRLQALQPEGLGLSVVALAELYEGVYYSRDLEQSEQKLNLCGSDSSKLASAFSEMLRVLGFDTSQLAAG